jgi:anti-sigma-K factor RskA
VSDSAISPDGGCGDAALHLLGLLDDEQNEAFLEHARSCAVCRDEIGSLQAAVDVLPATVPQLSAPEHVKRLVMKVVHGEAVPDARAPRRLPGVRRWLAPVQLTSPRPALALGAAVLVAVGVAIGALSASSPSGATTRVVSADVTIAGARATLHQSGGHDWLTVAGMPQPPAGRIYEVWVKRPGGSPQPTSSLFTPTKAGTASAAVPEGLSHGSEVMVTQEPAGGSQAPTSMAIIVARVA